MDEVRLGHRAVYDANAPTFDAGRGRGLVERPWLDRLLARVPPGGRVLDLGCGAGEPIAAYLLAQGRDVTGLDFSPAMLRLARSRFPAARWIEGDMRMLDLAGRFHGNRSQVLFPFPFTDNRAVFRLFQRSFDIGAGLSAFNPLFLEFKVEISHFPGDFIVRMRNGICV